MMRLSEAGRLGAMLKPQSFGSFLSNGKTCFVGAAMDAIGKLPKSELWANVVALWRPLRYWPESIVMEAHCPECGKKEPLLCICSHLNDQHLWTRERIADWVDLVDPPKEQPVEQGHEAVSCEV